MTHNDNAINTASNFIISAIVFLFCLVWALIGEADIKIVAVTLAFIYFLKAGIDLEMNSGSKAH
jgi:hypothetical protein